MRPSTLLSVPLATALLLASTHGAWAASDRPRVSVLPVAGPGGADVQKAATKVVTRHGYQLVSTEQFRARTARLAASVDGADAIRSVAIELGLVAVVMGKVTVVKKKYSVRLIVRDGRDGEVAAQATFTGASRRGLAKLVEKGFWKKLGSSFRTTPAAGVAGKTIDTGEDPFASAPRPSAPAPAPAPEPRAAPA